MLSARVTDKISHRGSSAFPSALLFWPLNIHVEPLLTCWLLKRIEAGRNCVEQVEDVTAAGNLISVVSVGPVFPLAETMEKQNAFVK